MKTTKVAVVTSDPLLRGGATVLLDARTNVHVVPDVDQADVILLIEAKVTRDALTELGPLKRDSNRTGRPACVVVTDHFNDDDLLAAVLRNVVAIMPLRETGGPQLVNAVLAASNGMASFPPALQRKLLTLVQNVDREVLRPNGLTMSGLTERECDILRLLTEGLNTEQIAGKLSYSERTVKNVLHRVMRREGLRNRAHAAAFAVRACSC
ncbi:Helix-turn-helix transcriptional regulator [Kibdelosporangium sp. 4NS15]|uniref:Helix-turn-helix transcriptional regulator n=1 Tax=Kibdelosporangium persicum TaxID=2698649 RepID=A0ABX2FA97_9PSEU|nr:response regulator transcription factor [Kibdelosporangium persicum]NRN68054.1 Helix-turn-helix transcriptional regulator [Kibdelosporangium persicum]